MLDFLKDELRQIKEKGLYRRELIISGSCRERAIVDGKEVIVFCSNNYLGLADRPELKEAAIETLEEYGCSTASSRLISGTTKIHRHLEERLAEFLGLEDSILFPSGYTANLGAITSLVQEGDTVIIDRQNHASIIEACWTSRAKVLVYKHQDLDDLEKVLTRAQKFRRRLVVTDSVFSMDGDIAPLREIADLCERYGASLMVDEAHGLGVFGEKGKGVTESLKVENKIPVYMGSLSKALGTFGGFIAGSGELVDFLRNRSKSYIYTTALPPEMCASTIAALDLVEREPHLRAKLWKNVSTVKQKLQKMGLDTMGSESQIIPIFVGDAERAMEVGLNLLEMGIFLWGVRPPTVKEGTSRLRLSLMATHSDEDIEILLDALERISDSILKGKSQ